MTSKKKIKTSTQDYTFVELYKGSWKDSGYSIDLPHTEGETQVQVVLLKGQEISAFLVNRLRTGESKNGVAWSKWELWGQVTISTNARGNGPKRLNVYGKHRNRPGAPTPWSPFRNITNNVAKLQTIVAAEYISDFNREVERLYTENIGRIYNVDLEEHIVRPCLYTNTHKMVDGKMVSVRLEDKDGENKDKSGQYQGFIIDKTNTVYTNIRSCPVYLYANRVAYPMVNIVTLNDEYYDMIPQRMTLLMRSENPAEFTKKVFGKNNYRKDLVKACAQSSMAHILFASTLKNSVPIDWIVEYLNAKGMHTGMLDANFQQMKKYSKTIPELFKAMTPAQSRRLMEELIGEHNGKGRPKPREWDVKDTLRMFSLLTNDHNVSWAPGQIDAKGWYELHNFFDADLKGRKNGVHDIPKNHLAKKIEQIDFSDDFKLILPDNTKTLIIWGQKMGHCIGSYTNEAREGSSVFVGILENNTMIGNAEIRTDKKRLMQIFGKRNSTLSTPVLKKFTDVLVKEKVLDKDAFHDAFGYYMNE